MELQQLGVRSSNTREGSDKGQASGIAGQRFGEAGAASGDGGDGGGDSSSSSSSSSSGSDSDGEGEAPDDDSGADPSIDSRLKDWRERRLPVWARVAGYGLFGLAPACLLMLLAVRTDEQGGVQKAGFVFFFLLAAYVLWTASKLLKSPSAPPASLAAKLGPTALYTKLIAAAIVVVFLALTLTIDEDVPRAKQVEASCFTIEDSPLTSEALKYIDSLCPRTDYAFQLRPGMDAAEVSAVFTGLGQALRIVDSDFLEGASEERMDCYNITVNLMCNTLLPPCQVGSCSPMLPCRSTCQIGGEEGKCGFTEREILNRLVFGFPGSEAGFFLNELFPDPGALALVHTIFYTLVAGCQDVCQAGGGSLLCQEGSVCSPSAASFECLNETTSLSCPACAGVEPRGAFSRLVGVTVLEELENEFLLSRTLDETEQTCQGRCLANIDCKSLTFKPWQAGRCSLYRGSSFEVPVKGRAGGSYFSDLVGPRVRSSLNPTFNLPSLFSSDIKGEEGGGGTSEQAICFDGDHDAIPQAASLCTRQGQEAALGIGRWAGSAVGAAVEGGGGSWYAAIAVGSLVAFGLLSLISHGLLGARHPLSPFRLPRSLLLRTVTAALPCAVLAAAAVGMCAEAETQAAAAAGEGGLAAMSLPLVLAFVSTLFAVRCTVQCWEPLFFAPPPPKKKKGARKGVAAAAAAAGCCGSCWLRRQVTSLRSNGSMAKQWYSRNLSTTGTYALYALVAREVVEIVVQLYSLSFLATEIDFTLVLLGCSVMGFNNIVAPLLLYVRPTAALVTDLAIEAFFLIFNLTTAPPGALADVGFVIGLAVPTVAAPRGLREVVRLWHEQAHCADEKRIRMSRSTTLIARPAAASPGSRNWVRRLAKAGMAVSIGSGILLLLFLTIAVSTTLRQCSEVTGGLMGSSSDGENDYAVYPRVLFGDSLFDPLCAYNKATELTLNLKQGGEEEGGIRREVALFSGLTNLRVEGGGGQPGTVAVLDVPGGVMPVLAGLRQLKVANGVSLALHWDRVLCKDGQGTGAEGGGGAEQGGCTGEDEDKVLQLWAVVRRTAPWLKRLSLASNGLRTLEPLGQGVAMPRLTWLNVSDNALSSLPVLQTPLLQSLHADRNRLEALWPAEQAGSDGKAVETVHSLQELTVSHNLLLELQRHVTESVDNSIGKWGQERGEEGRIDLSFNRLETVQVQGQTSFFRRGRIDLQGNGLVWFGLGTFFQADHDWLLNTLATAADSLKVLELFFLTKPDSLADVSIDQLPYNYTSLCRLHSLEALHVGTYWRRMPECLGDLQRLEHLHMEYLQASVQFPPSLCQISSLKLFNIQLRRQYDQGFTHYLPSCVNVDSFPNLVFLDVSGNPGVINEQFLDSLVWSHPLLEYVELRFVSGPMVPSYVCSAPRYLSQLHFLAMWEVESVPKGLQNCTLLERITLDGNVNGVTKSFQLNLTEMPCLRCSSIDGSADWLAESGTVAAGRDLMRLMKQTPETRQEYSLLNPARTSACAAGGRSHLGCFSEPIAAKWYYCPTEPGALRVTPIGVSQMMHPDICPAKVARLLEAQRNQTNDQANRTSYIL